MQKTHGARTPSPDRAIRLGGGFRDAFWDALWTGFNAKCVRESDSILRPSDKNRVGETLCNPFRAVLSTRTGLGLPN